MNLKSIFVLAALTAAGSLATAQSIPVPRPISDQILATNKPNANGSYGSWPTLPEANIVWQKRVWQDIVIKDKRNELFKPTTDVDHTLFNTLVAAIASGDVKAYKDERFANEMQPAELAVRIGTIANTNGMVDPSSATPDINLVIKYRIKQDSIHLRDEDRTVVRILGVAPIVEGLSANGDKFDRELFWVYYCDALNDLAQTSVPAKPGITWADVLEARSFYGKTVKELDKHIGPQSMDAPGK
jgi:hypothetical protein